MGIYLFPPPNGMFSDTSQSSRAGGDFTTTQPSFTTTDGTSASWVSPFLLDFGTGLSTGLGLDTVSDPCGSRHGYNDLAGLMDAQQQPLNDRLMLSIDRYFEGEISFRDSLQFETDQWLKGALT